MFALQQMLGHWRKHGNEALITGQTQALVVFQLQIRRKYIKVVRFAKRAQFVDVGMLTINWPAICLLIRVGVTFIHISYLLLVSRMVLCLIYVNSIYESQ